MFSKFLAGLLISLFVTLSLINIRQYSHTIDERAAANRAEVSIAYTKSLLKIGPPLSKEQTNFLSKQFHPSLYSIVNRPVSRFAENVLGLDLIESGHFFGIIFSAVGLVFLFLLAQRMFSPEVGLYAVSFMIFFPRFIAHAQYNPKDIPTMVGAIISVYAMVLALERNTWKATVLAGISMGLAASMGLNGLILIPVFVCGLFTQRQPSWMKLAGLAVLSSVLALYLTWPKMWINPLQAFDSIKHFSSQTWWDSEPPLYFGRYYSAPDLPWHYTLVYFLLATPLPTLLFAGAGIFVFFKNKSNPNVWVHALLLSWLVLPILIRSRSGIIRYNEMRHVFISVPPLMIYAGLGLHWVTEKIKNVGAIQSHWVKAFGGLVLLFYFVSEVKRWHPYEGSYYNEPVRWAIPNHIENYFLLTPWGMTGRQMSDWIDKNAEPHSSFYMIPETWPSLYPHRSDLTLKQETNADYAALTGDMIHWPNYAEFLNRTPVYTEQRCGSLIFLIYKNDKKTSGS